MSVSDNPFRRVFLVITEAVIENAPYFNIRSLIVISDVDQDRSSYPLVPILFIGI